MELFILKTKYNLNNVVYLLFLIFFCVITSDTNSQDIPKIFSFIYPKLKHLSSDKIVYFDKNYGCTYDESVSHKIRDIIKFYNHNNTLMRSVNDNSKKYFCMVNNSVYILINETLYKSIDSEIFPNLDNIQKYNIIPYLIINDNKIIYIITFISNNTSINFYLYELIFSNISQSNILKSNLIKTHIINDTDLSNDISCQLINYNSYLKCFYHKINMQVKIFIASFKIENNYEYENQTSNENLFNFPGAKDNVIKTSLIMYYSFFL